MRPPGADGGSLSSVQLTLDPASGVAEVMLDRPSKMNALDIGVFGDLEVAFAAIAREGSAVRSVVLSGAGAHFCAGLDLSVLLGLKQLAKREPCPSMMRASLTTFLGRIQRAMQLPERCHAPVVAACQGMVIGGAVDLVTACDLRVCSADARFSVKEVDLAIVADLGTLQRLPYIVGEQRARELAFTGRDVAGAEAKEIGLVLDCLDDGAAALERARGLARDIAKKPPLTVQGIKHNLNFSRDVSVEAGLEHVLRWNAAHLVSEEMNVILNAITSKGKKKKG